MKKLAMTVAVLACAGIASAQVYSSNIVGYGKSGIPANAAYIAGVQFDLGVAKVPSSVFGSQLPVGTTLYTYNGGYSSSTFIDTYDASYNPIQAWDNDALNLSAGFWVQNNAASPVSPVVAGEVPLAATIDTGIVSGLQLLTYPYPVAMEVQNLGLTPSVGDTIYVYNGGYSSTTFIDTYDASYNPIQAWDNPTLTVNVSQGFWYSAASAGTWTATRPFTP